MSVYLRERLLKSKARKGQVQFFLDCYHNPTGRRWHEPLPLYAPQRRNDRATYLQVHEAAEQIRLKREVDLSLEMEGIASPQARKGDFIAFMQNVHSAKKANPNRVAAIAELRKFSNGTLTFAGITGDFIEAYQRHLLKTKRTANTAHIYFAHLITAIRKAQRKNLVSPLLQFERLTAPEQTERRVLSIDELRALVAAPCPDKQVELAFLFCTQTGLRWSDVSRLCWDNIEDGIVKIRQQKTKTIVEVPLSLSASRALERVKAEGIGGERVFHLPQRGQANIILARWSERAKVKPFTWHSSRHTFVTLSLASGGAVEVVSRLAGHKDLKTTMRYTHIDDRRKREAVALMPTL